MLDMTSTQRQLDNRLSARIVGQVQLMLGRQFRRDESTTKEVTLAFEQSRTHLWSSQ